MYSTVGFNNKTIEYFQGYLSQFVHGLCLSNKPTADSEQMKRVLHECIPIADKFIQAVSQMFHDKEMVANLISSDIFQNFINSNDFNLDDLSVFANALVRKDKTILI